MNENQACRRPASHDATATRVEPMDSTKYIDERQAAAEAAVIELTRLGDDLLEQTEASDPSTVQSLRNEATRLFAVAYDITAALAHDEIDTAYHLSVGDDIDGDSLGVAV